MRRLWIAILRYWRRHQNPRIRHARRMQRINPWRLT